MSDSELQQSFAQMKSNILNKIQGSKEKWQNMWISSQGNPTAEAELIQLNLEISIVELEVLKELNIIAEKIKRAMGE